MKKTYSVLLTLTVVAGLATSAFGALEPWSENFSFYSNGDDLVSPWFDDSTNGGTRVVAWDNWLVGNPTNITGNVMYGGDGNGNDAWRSVGTVTNGTFTVELKAKVSFGSPVVGTRAQDFGIINYSTDEIINGYTNYPGLWDDYQAHLRISSNVLYAIDGTNVAALTTLAKDQWYAVKLVVSPDTAGGSYDVYLDGSMLTNNFPFDDAYDRDIEPSTAFGTTFNTGNDIARFFFDDIVVAELPPPSVYVDFGDTLSVTSPDSEGRYWNEAGSGIVGGGAIANLVDEDNGDSGIDLAVTGAFFGDQPYGYDNGSSASLVVDWPVEASGDSWAVTDSSSNTIQLADLTANGYYDITVYGGRFPERPPYSNAGRGMEVVDNATSKTIRLYTEGEDVHTLRGVQANASGQIDLTFDRISGDVGHLCAMKITEVPEPPPTSIYVDFGDHIILYDNDAHNRWWNMAGDSNALGLAVLTDLRDEYKVPTTVDINVTEPFTDADTQYGYDGGNSASGVVDWPTHASGDTWMLSTAYANTDGTIQIEGLVPYAPYELIFYGGRFVDTTQTRNLTVSNGTGSVVLNTAEEDVDRFASVQANASGEIEISFSTGNDNAHLNAMRITALPFAAHSEFDVAIEVISGSQVEISWDSEPGYSYKLQSKSDLVPAGSWTDVDTGITGTGGNVASTQTVSGTEAFYKVSTE